LSTTRNPDRPQEQTPKIKFEKVKFFGAQKLTVNSPRFTSNPPRIHHQKTTLRTHLSAKTPAKTPFRHAKKNFTHL
jgi:hypothetical protein